MVNVGKYTSPMDGMGIETAFQYNSFNLVGGWTKLSKKICASQIGSLPPGCTHISILHFPPTY